MKKLLVLSVFAFLLCSTTIIAQNSWGSWRTTDCLKGLDFRVKRGDYNKYAKKYKWFIEYKNRYRDNIHFSTIAVSPDRRSEIRSSGKTTNRLHADGNGGTVQTYFLIDASSSIYVHINRIRINEKDYGVDYYDCDN